MARPTKEAKKQASRISVVKARNEFSLWIACEINKLDSYTKRKTEWTSKKEAEFLGSGAVVTTSFMNYMSKLIEQLKKLSKIEIDKWERSEAIEKANTLENALMALDAFIFEASKLSERNKIRNLVVSLTKSYKQGFKESGEKTKGRPKLFNQFNKLTQTLQQVQ